MRKQRQYRDLPDTELEPEVDRMVRAMTEVAENDLEKMRGHSGPAAPDRAVTRPVPDEG